MRQLLKITLSLAVALLFMGAGTALAQNNTATIEQVSGSSGLQGATAKQFQTSARGATAFIRQQNSPNGPMTAVQDQTGFSADGVIRQDGSARALAKQRQDGWSRAKAEQFNSPDATSRQRQFGDFNAATVLQNGARRSTAVQKQFSDGNTATITQLAPSVSGGPTGNTAIQIQN